MLTGEVGLDLEKGLRCRSGKLEGVLAWLPSCLLLMPYTATGACYYTLALTHVSNSSTSFAAWTCIRKERCTEASHSVESKVRCRNVHARTRRDPTCSLVGEAAPRLPLPSLSLAREMDPNLERRALRWGCFTFLGLLC